MSDNEKHPSELIDICRSEVDRELQIIREAVEKNAWTPERAEELAKKVSETVVIQTIPMIKAELLRDLKVGVGDATLKVGWKALQIVGVAVLAIAFSLEKIKFPWGQ